MRGFSFKKIDWLMVVTVLALITMSVMFIYSAQYKEGIVVMDKYRGQMVFAVLGLGIYGFLTWFDYRYLMGLAPWIYGGMVALLLLVFAFPALNGAQRWIPLPGLTLQPSELAKISTAVTLGAYLGVPGRDMDDIKTFLVCAALSGFIFFLIAVEPDLGTSLIIVPITLSIMLYMGVQRKLLLIGMGMAVLFAVFACFWIAFEKPEEPVIGMPKRAIELPRMPLLEEYQKQRIKVFLNNRQDMTADVGWNSLQAKIAVGSGGMKGKGYLHGSQNILGFLPKNVAHSDFIFCVIAEETGFLGGVFLLILYSILLGRCMRAAVRAREDFGRLIALGISVMLFCHVFVNIAMTIGVVPVTGLPLPLMSYGGTYMVSTLIALGLVQSIQVRGRSTR